ncbi:MAG: hypothetical protein B9S32_07840 [Verrucomicrobia bacterium Tous-C9LFEB]|nr:MAG: hypothetical protein B9S32_07840 [Verrucomicrobia bacterium Tous-C9LFEB]
MARGQGIQLGGRVLMMFFIMVAPLFAQNQIWNAGNNDWYTVGNWVSATGSATTVPNTGDVTWINNGGTANIASGTGLTSTLSIGLTNSGTLVLNGGQLSIASATLGINTGATGAIVISNAASVMALTGALRVGDSGTGSITITAGAILGGDASLALTSGSTATVTISGSSSILGGATLLVGQSGRATVDVSNGGRMQQGSSTIALFNGSTGSVTIRDAGSTWTVSGTLSVGAAGTGTLTVTNGGLVSVDTLEVGGASSGTGTVLVSGLNSRVHATTSVTLGAGGTASMVVERGGSLTGGAMTVGLTSTASLLVTGTQSSLTGTGLLTVGDFARGTLTVTDGATVQANAMQVGTTAGAPSTVTVSGTNSSVQVGTTLVLGLGGTASMTVEQGAAVTANGLTVGEGNLLVTGTQSTVTVANQLIVGNGGVGNLTVVNGATVEANSAAVGNNVAGSGTITVSGTNSMFRVATALNLGEGGAASMTIDQGATVTAGSMMVGDVSTASVLLTGAQSTFNTAGGLMIGNAGDGSFTLNQGAVANIGGTVSIGTGAGSGILNIGAASNSAATQAGVLNTLTVSGNATGTLQFNTTTTVGSPYYFTNTGTAAGTDIALSGDVNIVHTAGYTIFRGANTNDGTAQINGGTMILRGSMGNTAMTVNSGGSLGGGGSMTGALDVKSGGSLAPSQFEPGAGPQTLSVGSVNLRSGSTTYVQINGITPGQYDTVAASGNATVNGMLRVTLGYVPAPGETISLITTGTGSTGSFSSIVTNLDNALIYTSTSSGNNLLLTAAQGSFARFAQTPNQQAVATVLNQESTSPKLAELYRSLNGLPGMSLGAAMDKIAPEELSAITNFGFSNTRAVFGMLNDRFDAIRRGETFTNGLTVWDPSLEFSRNSLLASNDPFTYGVQTADPRRIHNPDIGMFISGQGTFGDVNGDDSHDDGFNFNAGGVILGVDYRVCPGTAVGVYGGYQGTQANLSDNGTATADSGKFGLYATHAWQNGTWVNGSIGGGVHRYDTERSSYGGTATGSTNGKEANVHLQVGHDFKMARWTITPNLQLGYNRLWTDAYTESGSLAPMSIQSQTSDSLRSVTGVRVTNTKYVSRMNWTMLSSVSVGWAHEFLDTTQSVTASFADGAGSLFTTDGVDMGADSVVMGVGENILFSEYLSGGAGYTADVNPNYFNHNLTGSMTYRF